MGCKRGGGSPFAGEWERWLWCAGWKRGMERMANGWVAAGLEIEELRSAEVWRRFLLDWMDGALLLFSASYGNVAKMRPRISTR